MPSPWSPTQATLLPDRDTPSVCFVADDVDQVWSELRPYLLHDARVYADWNPGNDTTVGITPANTVAELRAAAKGYRVFSVAQAIAYLRDGGMLNLAPLCGGLPPERAWPYLQRVVDAVLPARGSYTTDDRSERAPVPSAHPQTPIPAQGAPR